MFRLANIWTHWKRLSAPVTMQMVLTRPHRRKKKVTAVVVVHQATPGTLKKRVGEVSDIMGSNPNPSTTVLSFTFLSVKQTTR